MTDVPVRLESGEIGCPRCQIALEIGKSPFMIHNEYVGHFESLICSICNFHLFTSSGYDGAIKKANDFGLVGHEEVKEVFETDSVSEELFTLYPTLHFVASSFDKIFEGNDIPVSGHTKSELIVPLTQRTLSKSKIRSNNF